MDADQKENELSHWFSTYGLITAERILGKYSIVLPQETLLSAIKDPASFYHRILQVPLKNVLNGIVLQQAHDYHVYAQKLFIDYLLSGDSAADENSQGASTRERMEEERLNLITLGKEFHQQQLDQDSLIAASQAYLIKVTKEWNEAEEGAVFHEHLETYLQQAKEMNAQARMFRSRFYNAIIRVTELIKLMPNYRIDEAQDLVNREPLYFDKTIGD